MRLQFIHDYISTANNIINYLREKSKNKVFFVIIHSFLTFFLILYVESHSILNIFRNDIIWESHFHIILFSLLVFFTFWYSFIQLIRLSILFSYVIFPIIITTSFLITYASSRYQAVCDELPIAIFNTTWNESLNYVNCGATIRFIAFFILMYMGIFIYRLVFATRTIKSKQLSQFFLSIVLLATSFLIPSIIKNNFPQLATSCLITFVENNQWTLQSTSSKTVKDAAYQLVYGESLECLDVYYSLYQPVRSVERFYNALYNFLNPPQLTSSSSLPSAIVWAKLPDNVVLYVGESYRADHSVLNGYHRNTQPFISQQDNIINLPNLHCDNTQTITSIYSLLTASYNNNHKPTHTSFIDILLKHGYRFFLLVGQNTEGQWYHTPLISNILKNRVSFFTRPKSPQEYFQEISSINNVHKSPRFYLIEDGAGHSPFHSTKHIFGKESTIDRYDNALLDIDETISNVIKAIQDSSSILIFTSDHGESFGEEGRYGHGGPKTATEQTHVCAFIWFSNKYRHEHPEIIYELQKNADKFTSFEHIYHTIISMSGIRSDIQIKKLDMSQNQASN